MHLKEKENKRIALIQSIRTLDLSVDLVKLLHFTHEYMYILSFLSMLTRHVIMPICFFTEQPLV